jgi:uncharacterized protein YkwD
MHRPGLWIATTLALGVLILGSVPAAASVSRRTVAPVVSQHRVAGSLRFGSRLTEGVTTALPQSPARTRGIPAPVAPLTFTDAYHMSQQQILINQDRANNGGLAPLAWSPCLTNIALANAQRVAAQGFLSHTNGPTLDLACDASYHWGGENLFYTSAGIDDVAANTAFMNSATHRANILNTNYRFVGTAWVLLANGYGYIAEEFGG